MGCGAGVELTPTSDCAQGAFQLIPDQYNSFEEVTAALRLCGLEKSQLIVGVDFTRSNLDTGAKSFGGRSLHDVSQPSSPNPYWQALNIIAKALWDFDDDHQIPVYGFGDATSGSGFVFSFEAADKPSKGLVAALKRYEKIAGTVTLSGPTSFAPLVRQAIKIVRETFEYHILLIIADGQISASETNATTSAIVEASNYGLSIVMVGVGDGPWDLMDQFDDELPERRFDNFQFVNFNEVFKKYPGEKTETAFATHALMEVPEQYRLIAQMGLLRPDRVLPFFRPPPLPQGPPDKPDRNDPHYGLPEGWVAVYDHRRSSFFYLNKVKNETVWEIPKEKCEVGSPDNHTSRGAAKRIGRRDSLA